MGLISVIWEAFEIHKTIIIVNKAPLPTLSLELFNICYLQNAFQSG